MEMYRWLLLEFTWQEGSNHEQPVKAEYHKFPENTFCTGSTFVPKQGGVEEDDGLIITFVHNEERNVSQVSR